MTPNEVLEAARQILLSDGWVQNRYSSDDGFCLVGAVNEVVPRDEQFGRNWEHAAIPAMRMVRQIIDENPDSLHDAGNGHGTSLHLWNDDPRRSLDEVLDAIACALKDAPVASR